MCVGFCIGALFYHKTTAKRNEAYSKQDPPLPAEWKKTEGGRAEAGRQGKGRFNNPGTE